MSFEWDNDNILELINIYRKKEELWNPTAKNYHMKQKKNSAWDAVADEMGCDVNEVKKKMLSLLSSYRRERGKTRRAKIAGNGRAKIYKSNWFAFESFEFLRHKHASLDSSNPEIISDNETEQDPISTDVNETDVKHNCSQIDNIEQSVYRNEENNSRKRKILIPPVITNTKRKPKEDLRLVQTYNILDSMAKTHHDECSTFGEHIVSKLRKFSGYQRSLLMHRINNLIFEMETEFYTQEGYNVNTSSSSTAYTSVRTPQCSPDPIQSPVSLSPKQEALTDDELQNGLQQFYLTKIH